MNTLSERLKYARRELTALKTAHPRALGNLRVYRRSEVLTSTAGSRELFEILITLAFSTNYAPFPFTELVGGQMPSGVGLFEVEEFEYSNDGMSATAKASGLFNAGASMPYEVLSMAPVVSISTQWRII